MSYRMQTLIKALKLQIYLCLAFFVFSGEVFAQDDYGWWNSLVQWDGKSHWSEYMIYTPKYFGPNALPVQEIKNGSISNTKTFEFGFASHWSQGDDAQNLLLKMHLPLATNRVALNFSLVPIELYQMDAATRDLRRARDFDGRGHAIGDLYINTLVQLTNVNAPLDLLLSINLKTASGSNREATRYTDGTGYSFDLSAGKTIQLNGEQESIKAYGQLGLYVWETNEDRNPQNDAFSFGAGLTYQKNKTVIEAQAGGYIGYKGNGDKPIVFRSSISHHLKENLLLKLGNQIGFADFEYNSILMSIIRLW